MNHCYRELNEGELVSEPEWQTEHPEAEARHIKFQDKDSFGD